MIVNVGDNLYKIGEFSKLSGVSIRALRFYDKIDLLKPDEVDIYSGYRFYSNEKLKDLKIIKLLQTLNFSLDEIKNNWDNFSINLFEIKKSEIECEIDNFNNKLLEIDSLMKVIENGKIILEKSISDYSNIVIKKQGYDDYIYLNGYFCKDKYEAVLLNDNVFDYFVLYNGNKVIFDLLIDKSNSSIFNVNNILMFLDDENIMIMLFKFLSKYYSNLVIVVKSFLVDKQELLLNYGFKEDSIVMKIDGRFIKFKKELGGFNE